MLDWIPERVSASGGLSAEGFYKLLGRPSLDPLTVLVREMAQNCWDARSGESQSVRFELELKRVGSELRSVLRNEVFENSANVGLNLEELLAESELHILTVSDRGTCGLNGPPTAEIASEDRERNWANFVLNAGQSKSGGKTGGTYGFGKTIAYVVSQANTVVIHTRTKFQGNTVTRLIASTIGKGFINNGLNYTGRHWWGVNRDGDPLPLEGEAADLLAKRLGFSAFEGDELGTNIMIIAPDLGQRSPEQAATFLSEALLWHLWPKLVSRGSGVVPMRCSVRHDGTVVAIPSFASRPPLARFVEAYKCLVLAETPSLTFQKSEIGRSSPRKMVLGHLGTVPFVREQRAFVDDGHSPDNEDSPAPASPFSSTVAHHVALLRGPELVVDYLPGPIAADPLVEWVGVFRALDEYDEIFARSEPPTHDAWNPDTVEDRSEKNILRKVLRDIHTEVTERWGTAVTPAPEGAASTAGIADLLGHLVLGKKGQGKGRQRNSGSPNNSAVRRPTVSFVESEVVVVAQSHVSKAVFEVSPVAGEVATELRVSVGIAIDGQGRDPSLDESLHLLRMNIDGTEVNVEGTEAVAILRGSHSQRVELEAANSGRLSLLWEIDAKSLEETSLES